MSSVKQTTAKSVAETRCWIETNAHHKASAEDGEGYLVLSGSHARLRIPPAIWMACFVKPGDQFDQRMYRWDHDAELNAIRLAAP